MADEAAVMFTAGGKATPLLIGRWHAKGAAVGLQPGAVLLEADRSGSRTFRGVWALAFPTRSPLPFGALATAEGKFSDRMLNVWL